MNFFPLVKIGRRQNGLGGLVLVVLRKEGNPINKHQKLPPYWLSAKW